MDTDYQRSFVFVRGEHATNPGKKVMLYLDELLQRTGNFSKTPADPVLLMPVPEELLREHYSHLSGLSIYEKVIVYYAFHGIIPAIYHGPDIVNRVIIATGPTDPSKGESWQVRRYFSNDSLELALLENRPVRNVIHRSANSDEAEREFQIWKDFLRQRGIEI